MMEKHFACFLRVIGFFSFTCAVQASPSNDETLRIMLQGSSTPDLEALIASQGGTITHLLPVINAVGASVTAQQLKQIKDSPLVMRVIDDLSTGGSPEDSVQQQKISCEVGGKLELEFNGSGFSWTIHNKSEYKALLQSLSISWPANLGNIDSITWGKLPINSKYYPPAQAGELSMAFTTADWLDLGASTTLTVTFDGGEDAWKAVSPAQSDFDITATFGDECITKLIPGYTDNNQNTYFPSVIGADHLHRHGVTGQDVTVAIIDSGLWEVAALTNNTQGNERVVARYDAISDIHNKEVVDETGHGTHLTSVIAHSGKVTKDHKDTGSYKGVAPDVNLVVVKAFNVAGQGDMLDIVRAVQYVIDHQKAHNIKVLNLSFAARPRWPYWQDPINQAVMKAWAAGITVVAAGGNEGPEPMSIGSPGNLPYLITVGAVTDSWTVDTKDDDYIPDFSSRGPTPTAHIKPDIVAPGGHMIGLAPAGSSLTLQHPDYTLSSGGFVMTGTSQASALVSGVVALLLQLEPDLSPDDVKCKLITSAELAINANNLLAYSPFQQGYGYVSATRAVTLGQRGCGNPDLNIRKDIRNLDHYEGPAIISRNGEVSLPGLENMISGWETEKGLSKSRKWGVKAHIERNNLPATQSGTASNSPFDWESAYQNEKILMEKLAEEPQN